MAAWPSKMREKLAALIFVFCCRSHALFFFQTKMSRRSPLTSQYSR